MKGNSCFLSLVVAAGILCTAPALVAQTLPGDTISGKTHQIDDVTVTAPRRRAQVTSVVPVQRMQKEELQQLGLQDLADAVRRFAGANVKDYGGIGGLKTVSVRNMGAAHTAVSYDGVPVSNCLGGQIDIGRFSLDNVEMLSLAVGQHEDMLQSARLYASAGVLSIETEKPHFAEGRTSALRTRLQGGSFGFVSPSLRWWQQLGGRTKFSVDATYLRADGNYPFTLKNGKEVTRERRNNSDIYSWQGEANLYHTLRDSSQLSVKAYYYYSKRGLPGSVTLYNPISNEKLWDENFFAQSQYRKRLNARWSLNLQAKYTHGWNRTRDYGKQYTDGMSQDWFRQDELYASAALLYRPLPQFTFSLAQDGIYNHMSGSLKECPFPTRYTSLTALRARYEQAWLRLDVSLIHTATFEEVEKGDAPDNFRRLSPSVALNLKPFEAHDLYIRLLYKSTFRLPTFNDLYYYRLGNRSLNPEKASEYNVGFTWALPSCGPFRALTLTVDGYYNRVTDKIVAFPSTFTWRMVNYGKVDATGVDVTLSTTLPLAQRWNLMLSGAYMWQKAIDVTNPEAKNYKDQLPYTPQHSGNGSLLLQNPWVNVGYTIVGMGTRYSMAQNLPEYKIQSYVEQTVTLSRQFKLKRGGSLSLKAECVNLADKQYEVIQYYPMAGRSWRGSLEWNF